MAEYFRTCSRSVLAALRSVSQHQSAILQQQGRRKQCQQLKSTVQEFVRTSPLQISMPELLTLANALRDQHEYSLALSICCQTIIEMLETENTAKGDFDGLAALQAQVQVTAARCAAAMLATEDPELALADSVSSLVVILSKLQAAMQSMLPDERNHWLVYLGAQTIKEVCAAFRSTSGRETLQFLAFAVLALDTDLTFSLPEHLPLRIDLYLALAKCQQTVGMQEEALTTIQQGQAAISAIEKLEQLEPLPPPPEAQAAYQQAKTRLNTAHFAITAATLPTEQAVKDALQSMFSADSDRLTALAVSLLPTAPNRVVKHQPCPAALAKLLSLAEALVKPHLAHFQASSSPEEPGSVQPGPELELAKTILPLLTHQVAGHSHACALTAEPSYNWMKTMLQVVTIWQNSESKLKGSVWHDCWVGWLLSNCCNGLQGHFHLLICCNLQTKSAP